MPQELKRIIDKALEKDRNLRYQSAAEMRADLQRLKQNTESGTSLATTGTRSGRKLLTIVNTSFVVIALLVGGYFFVRRSKPQESTATPEVKHRRSVAVLGFKNLAGNPDKAWLSTAIAEMLTTNLEAGQQLRLVPGETVAKVKNNLSLIDAETYAQETLDKIHRQTSADDVVVGSYLALGPATEGKVQLDLRLQEAEAGETLIAFNVEGTEKELTELVSRAGARLREKLGVGDIAADDLAAVKASSPSTPDAIRFYSEGLAKQRAYDDRAALDLLQKAVAADPNYALAHSALSEAWFGVGHHMDGMEEAKRAFDLSGNLSKEDRLWTEGQYLVANGDSQKAVDIYKTLFDLHSDNLEYGLRFAESQDRIGKSREALATLEALGKLPQPERDDPRIDLDEAAAAFSLSNWQTAQDAIQRAIKKGNESGARLIVAAALDTEGILRWMRDDTDQSLVSWNEARDIYAQVGDLDSSASVLKEIAMLSFETGEIDRAGAVYRKARDIHARSGNVHALADDLRWLGDAYLRQGNLKGAMESYQQSLATSRKIDFVFEVVASLQGIGDTLMREGDPRGAQQFYEKSLQECRGHKDSQNMSFCLSSVEIGWPT